MIRIKHKALDIVLFIIRFAVLAALKLWVFATTAVGLWRAGEQSIHALVYVLRGSLQPHLPTKHLSTTQRVSLTSSISSQLAQQLERHFLSACTAA